MFKEFHEHEKLVKGLNAAFIVVIPKSENPNSVLDYRPISLIKSVYKLNAKVLVARLQSVMHAIITANQFVSVQGRQIADCILIANEVVDAMRKHREGGLVLKLDFAKTYDNIDWTFLLDLLREMGFGIRWVQWMEGCVSTTSLAVLVNGSPTDFFKIEKGLCHGDPLSP